MQTMPSWNLDATSVLPRRELADLKAGNRSRPPAGH